MISMVILGDGEGFRGCLFAQAQAATIFILYHYNYVEIALLKIFTGFQGLFSPIPPLYPFGP